jgi:hypothetical protein
MTDPTSQEVTLYHPVGEGGRLSGFDEKLLEMSNKRMSGEQMYAALGSPSGLSPARCIQRVKEIVRSTDYMTILDSKAMLLLDMVKLRDILFERVQGTEIKITKHGDEIEVEASPGWANALIRLLREFRTTIDSMAKDVQDGQMAVSKAHAQIMMAAISVMFDRFVARLEDYHSLYKELPPADEMRVIFEEVMPFGFSAIQEEAA